MAAHVGQHCEIRGNLSVGFCGVKRTQISNKDSLSYVEFRVGFNTVQAPLQIVYKVFA